MTNPQRVVVLGSYAPSLLMFRGALIEEMVRRGHQVIAVAPNIQDKEAAGLRRIGAEPRQIALVNNSLGIRSTFATLQELKRLFRELQPDVLIAYTIKPVTLGIMAAAAAGVARRVALITGIGFAFTEGPGLRRKLSRLVASILYRRALQRANAVIFQNPDDRQYFSDKRLLRGKEGIIVNGSGVDLDRFAAAPLPPAPRFLMIGRLNADKGVREYAAAAEALKARHPAARFELVGYFDGLASSITAEELDRWSKFIDFTGKLEDVRPAIARASVYVLPSWREGTPRSSLEALAMGRPVVTTDAPGCRETVREGVNGFLVPVRDPVRLAEAMERFILDPRLAARMGERSREIAVTKYDVHKVNAEILEAAGL